MNRDYIPLFSENEYNSADGLNTRCWGPPLWMSLHMISFGYKVDPTEDDKDNYHNFLMSLKYVLPCRACRENYARNLETIGYSRDCLENRKSFSMFIYRLHNCVNKMLGKECVLTYNQVRDRYEMFRAKCGRTPDEKTDIKKEKGCETPVFGKKQKTVISIVPAEKNCDSFKVDSSCIPKKMNKKKN